MEDTPTQKKRASLVVKKVDGIGNHEKIVSHVRRLNDQGFHSLKFIHKPDHIVILGISPSISAGALSLGA